MNEIVHEQENSASLDEDIEQLTNGIILLCRETLKEQSFGLEKIERVRRYHEHVGGKLASIEVNLLITPYK